MRRNMKTYKKPCPVDEMTVEQAKEYLKVINKKSVWDMTDEEQVNRVVADAIIKGESIKEAKAYGSLFF